MKEEGPHTPSLSINSLKSSGHEWMQVLPELAHAHTQISTVFSEHLLSLTDVTTACFKQCNGASCFPEPVDATEGIFQHVTWIEWVSGRLPRTGWTICRASCSFFRSTHAKKHQNSNQSCDSLRWSLFIITEVNTKSYRYEYTCKAYFPALTFSRKNSFPESDRRHHWPAGNYCG